ncbi:Protein detoxification51 [Vitis vinifera]|uniref:Protein DETOXIFICATION n=1 Tax=Vitis vinifera TaxID=29760 RepID=A0A438DS78_VITVI|nr:Protein detoxification51 [Vitis vinifera]
MTLEKVGGAKAQSTAFLAVKSHFSLQMILLTCTPPDPLVGSISQISVPQSDHPNCHPRVAATLRNEKVSERERARVGAAVHESISEEAETEEAKTSEREFAAAAVVVESSVCVIQTPLPTSPPEPLLTSPDTRCFRACTGDGALVLTSLWSSTSKATLFDPSSLCDFSSLLISTHLTPLAQHVQNSSYLHQDPDITRIAHTYLVFSLPDLFTNSFIHPIRIYLRAQGITHPLTIASLLGTILHLPINLILVSHLRLGVAGVAAASSASNFFVLIFLVSYVWARGIHEPTWTAPSIDCLTGWKPLLRLAAPSCVSVCLEWWWYEIMIVLCGLLVNPKATVASMGVLIQTTSLIYVFPSSLGFAVSSRVGNELGANRPDKARVSAMVSVFLAGVMGFSATMFASGMRDRWGRMFTSDVEILRLTSAALPILGLCELGNCPQTVGCGVLRGSARPSTAANVNLGAFYLVGMPVAVGLGFWLGVGFCGLWVGLLAAQVCCAGMMLYVVGTTDWNYQAMRAKTLTCAGCGDTVSPLPTADTKDEEQPLICIVVTSSS